MGVDVSMMIKAFAEENGLTNADIARASGVSRSAVTKWFQGTSQPKAEALIALSQYYHIPVALFYQDELDTSFREKIDEIREQIHEVSAGHGRINEDYETQTKQDDSTLVRICGDSMLPTLHDGDMVRVIPASHTNPEDYTIVKINGDEAVCKHVEITDTGIWLKADNTDVYQDKFFSVQECLTLPVQIIGKAVEIVSRKL